MRMRRGAARPWAATIEAAAGSQHDRTGTRLIRAGAEKLRPRRTKVRLPNYGAGASSRNATGKSRADRTRERKKRQEAVRQCSVRTKKSALPVSPGGRAASDRSLNQSIGFKARHVRKHVMDHGVGAGADAQHSCARSTQAPTATRHRRPVPTACPLQTASQPRPRQSAAQTA